MPSAPRSAAAAAFGVTVKVVGAVVEAGAGVRNEVGANVEHNATHTMKR